MEGFSLSAGNLIPLLARRHRIDLVSLARSGDEPHLDWARRHCASVDSIPVGRSSLPLRLGNFVSGYLWGRNLVHRKEVLAVLDAGVRRGKWDILHVEGGFMAGLIPEAFPLPKVLAVHDSEVLRAQEMLRCQPALRARLSYTLRRLYEPRYGRLVYPRFEQCIMIAERDAAFNRKLVPEANFCAIAYGIDCNYFHPMAVEKDPLSLVFHGNLAYVPNIEAASELANQILPLIRRENPRVIFHLVGATPTPQIRALVSRPGIKLSSDLPDLRSALCSAAIYVSAVQHGSGMKNKILEALALQLPIVCYEGSTFGIRCTPGKHLLVARDPEDFAAKVLALLRDPERAQQMGKAGCGFVSANYSWEATAAAYEQIYTRLVAGRQPVSDVSYAFP